LNWKDKLSFTGKITFRVPFLVFLVLFAGIGSVMTYYLQSQNSTIISSKESEIKQEAEIIYTAIKNNMLAGEAPIAVELFRDFERANFASMIRLFRADGDAAFSDNNTIAEVNRNIGEEKFTPKTVFPEKIKNGTEEFAKSVAAVSDIFLKNVEGDDKHLIIYKPLLNQPKCSACHGLDHVVRGVITISTPVNDVYRMARNNIIISIFLYAIVVIVLTMAIIYFLRRVLIVRILKIRSIVKSVGTGNFSHRFKSESEDEIGELGNEINSMIDGLKERFKLSKFVSKSTLDHIKRDDEIILGGEKKNLTVLFSDIRNFTGYSETRDPAEVLEMLNRVMTLQAEIIQKYGGDIDKFVGDELMAVFEGDDMVKRAAEAALEIKSEMKKIYEYEKAPVYVGIGINTGEMIAGNMGSKDRIDRTVIGDAVNLGARLCSIAGRNTIVVSGYSYKHISGDFMFREQKPVKVKGKDKIVDIYTLLGEL
jgi:class 3 adenylate cyclase